MNARTLIAIVVVVCTVMAGCASSPNRAIFESTSAVELRSYQSRAFDTTDRQGTLRTVIAALQDLGFVIDRADATLGTISATKLDDYELRVTVTARRRGATQTLVRISATHGNAPIEDPGPYQDFFTTLEKAMFLSAHRVD